MAEPITQTKALTLKLPHFQQVAQQFIHNTTYTVNGFYLTERNAFCDLGSVLYHTSDSIGVEAWELGSDLILR